MSETNGDAGADQLTISPHDGSRYPGRGWRGGGRSPNSAPDKCARLSVARPWGRVGRPCGRWAG